MDCEWSCAVLVAVAPFVGDLLVRRGTNVIEVR